MPSPGHRINRRGAPSSKAKLVMILALAILGLGAIGVVFILPTVVDTATTNASKLSSIIPQTKEIVKKVQQIPHSVRIEKPTAPPLADPNKERAKLLLNEALKRQARLENEGVKNWGTTILETSYPEAQAVLAKAIDEFDKQRFQSAIDGFQNAISLLGKLDTNKDKRYRRAIAAGDQAIRSQNTDEAAKRYRVALSIRPGDSSASAGVKRANTLPLVLAKMAEGKYHETSSKLDDALRAYRAAKALDGAYEPAAQNADRVAALIKDRDYRQAVSATLVALDSYRYGEAERALAGAARIRPKGSEISDLRRRIRLARQLAALTRLRRIAAAHEIKEQWKDAIKSYDKALRVDKSADFAVRGKALAQKYAHLHAQLEKYLSAPERLNSPEPLAHATQVLAAADEATTAGPRLKDSRNRLRSYISQALKPRPVLLQSDAKTSVTVYRVGRFGTFREKRLNLRPGAYTVVGSRSGYRDVRVRFRIGPTEAENIIVIKCTDRI